MDLFLALVFFGDEVLIADQVDILYIYYSEVNSYMVFHFWYSPRVKDGKKEMLSIKTFM